MRRRAVGVASVHKCALNQAKFSSKSKELAKQQLEELSRQLTTFKDHLKHFAQHYRKELKNDSEVRRYFQDMCALTGVDPLASRKGFFTELLGLGDFYYDLSVQMLEAALAILKKTGAGNGLVRIDKLLLSLNNADVSGDDVARVCQRLKVIGVRIVDVDNVKMLQLYPSDLDHLIKYILRALINAEKGMSAQQISLECKQDVSFTLKNLVSEGLLWFDEIDQTFWLASIFLQNK